MVGIHGSNECGVDITMLRYVPGGSEHMKSSKQEVGICSLQEGICIALKPSLAFAGVARGEFCGEIGAK